VTGVHILIRVPRQFHEWFGGAMGDEELRPRGGFRPALQFDRDTNPARLKQDSRTSNQFIFHYGTVRWHLLNLKDCTRSRLRA
jgi:hypothetical protein